VSPGRVLSSSASTVAKNMIVHEQGKGCPGLMHITEHIPVAEELSDGRLAYWTHVVQFDPALDAGQVILMTTVYRYRPIAKWLRANGAFTLVSCHYRSEIN